jgi:hypothetical protein
MPDLEIVDLLKEARNMRSLARRIRRLAHSQLDNKDRLKRDADALEQQAAVLEARAAEIRQPALF